VGYIGVLIILYALGRMVLKKKIKEVKTKESTQLWAKLPDASRKCIHKYAQNFGKPTNWAKQSTDTFIKEVYYATTHERINEMMTIEKMVSVIKEAGKQRAIINKFELDEAHIIDHDNVYVGMRRYFSNGETNRVKYILTNTKDGWKFNHITRDCKGTIVNKLAHHNKIIYVIETQGSFMLFAVPSNEDRFSMEELVYVDGFLEIKDTYQDDFYYTVHTIMSIQ
jgi:hypothetical protein